MRYRISHSTHYTYSQPAILSHHILRLRPRCDGTQSLHKFAVAIDPVPMMQTVDLDESGNSCLGLWFHPVPTTALTILTEAEVETHRDNPFDYLILPWAMTLPVNGFTLLGASLDPYYRDPLGVAIAGNVVELAHSILQEVNGNISYFLTTLTQRIYDDCTYQVRPKGEPLPSGITWEKKVGTCRDFAMVFIDACRAVGLAARFVSGYQEGDPDHPASDLHGWAEVYVPGGGWRGFDPTLGLTVGDRHIPLATGAHPRQAAPVTGCLREGSIAQSTLTSTITVQTIS